MKEIKTKQYKEAQKFLKTLKDMPVVPLIPGSPSYGDVAETATAPFRAVKRTIKDVPFLGDVAKAITAPNRALGRALRRKVDTPAGRALTGPFGVPTVKALFPGGGDEDQTPVGPSEDQTPDSPSLVDKLKDAPVAPLIPGSPSYGDVAETVTAPQRAVGRSLKRLWDLRRKREDK